MSRSIPPAQPRVGIGAYCLLSLAALLFTFLPRYNFTNLTGEWFTIGWPFSTGALKVGYVSPESPSGIHPHLNPFILLNAALWCAVFFGMRRFSGLLFPYRILVWATITLAVVSGALWFTPGLLHIIRDVAADAASYP